MKKARFTFVSMVRFPSCYHIRIVSVVHVRTILIYSGNATIIADVDHSVLSSAVFTPKKVEDRCMVVTAKSFSRFH